MGATDLLGLYRQELKHTLSKFWQHIKDPQRGPVVVSEIGSNFCASLEICRQSIRLSRIAGADAVKFQTFKAEEFVATPDLPLLIKDGESETSLGSQMEVFKSLELDYTWHESLADYAHDHSLYFSSSAADPDSLNTIVGSKADFIKLSSEDLINPKVLSPCAEIELPLVISTGMADEFEIERALTILTRLGKNDIVICHCVSSYPVSTSENNLARMRLIAQRFDGFPIGFSDHSIGSHSAIAATALGARFIEKHFTINKHLEGPDHSFSADLCEMKELTSAVKDTFNSTLLYEQTAIEPSKAELTFRENYRRSCVARTEIAAGSILTEEMVDFKRAGPGGIHPFDSEKVIGFALKKSVLKDHQFLYSDFA